MSGRTDPGMSALRQNSGLFAFRGMSARIPKSGASLFVLREHMERRRIATLSGAYIVHYRLVEGTLLVSARHPAALGGFDHSLGDDEGSHRKQRGEGRGRTPLLRARTALPIDAHCQQKKLILRPREKKKSRKVALRGKSFFTGLP